MEHPDYIDIHSHFTFSDFDRDRADSINALSTARIWTITVGTNIDTSWEAIVLAEQYPHLFATIGIHPTDTDVVFDETQYTKWAKYQKVVAIGECGLDYYRLQSDQDKVKQKQEELFIKHIICAQKNNLPLMIHGRPQKGSMDAYHDILDILENTYKGHVYKNPGNIHFFVGDIPVAKRFLDLGFTLSFDGPITFTREYDEVIKFIPLSMLMAETDAPFASPVPHRGKRNEPRFVTHIVDQLADIRGEDREQVRQATVTNAFRVFSKMQNIITR